MKNKNLVLIRVHSFLDASLDCRALFVALLFSSSLILYWLVFVKPMSCLGAMDCVKYIDMTNHFIAGSFGAIEHPFNLRIFTPWLASLISDDVLAGFLLINSIALSGFVIFSYLSAKILKLRSIEYLVLVFWFFWHPMGFGLYYRVPASADPLWYGFLGLFCYLFLSDKRVLLGGVMFFALFVKESFVFVIYVFVVSELVYAALVRDRRALGAMLSFVIAALVLSVYEALKAQSQIVLFPQAQAWEINVFTVVSWWLNEVINDPWRILVWGGALIYALGLFPFLLLSRWPVNFEPQSVRFLVFFILGAGGFMALGLLGGSDMSRIIFNGGFFLWLIILVAGNGLRTTVHQWCAFAVYSAALVLGFKLLFSSAFEYDYYIKDNRLWPTIGFLFFSFALGLYLKFRLFQPSFVKAQ